jgi:8-oxo-dGTP pyrophosphatase MutT (NUDIX family)
MALAPAMAECRAAQPEIRPAATLILVRQTDAGPAVLMGQRGSAAAFMPDKYVFPGGAVDPADTFFDGMLSPDCDHRLTLHSGGPPPSALAAAALRELAEETGLTLTHPAKMTFVFRAITPPGRSRRFLADAAGLSSDPDDFGRATDELSHLHWVPIEQARHLNLPFITEIVLAEVALLIAAIATPPARVPFFDNSGSVPAFRWIV